MRPNGSAPVRPPLARVLPLSVAEERGRQAGFPLVSRAVRAEVLHDRDDSGRRFSHGDDRQEERSWGR